MSSSSRPFRGHCGSWVKKLAHSWSCQWPTLSLRPLLLFRKRGEAEVCSKPPWWKWLVWRAASIFPVLNVESHQGFRDTPVSVLVVCWTHTFIAATAPPSRYGNPPSVQINTYNQWFKNVFIWFCFLCQRCMCYRAHPVLHVKNTHSLTWSLFFSLELKQIGRKSQCQATKSVDVDLIDCHSMFTDVSSS